MRATAMKCTLVSLFLFVLLTFPPALQAEEKRVTLATLTDFAPFCFRRDGSMQVQKETIPPGSDSLQLQGYSWDVVRQSFHEVGYTIDLYVVPWERVMHYLNSGKVDAIFPANRTEKREKIYSYSQEYVDRTKMVVYVPVHSPLVWESLDSLNGLSVGAVRGWAYGKIWESNTQIKKEAMDTILQSFDIMDKKRLDAVVGYEIVYDYVLKHADLKDKYRKIGYFGIVDEYLMGKKDDPEALTFLHAFDRGHRIIAEKGDLEKISVKWQD
jgi:polar amino acid transport system substrate-binding protein